MAAVARATFVTRPATIGRIQAMQMAGDSASVATSFRLSFERPVAVVDVAAAIHVTPAAPGTITVLGGRPDTTPSMGSVMIYTPDAPLSPGTHYSVSVGSLVDLDGAPVTMSGDLGLTTTVATRVELKIAYVYDYKTRPSLGAKKGDSALFAARCSSSSR